jgi:glyoxylase I family protein
VVLTIIELDHIVLNVRDVDRSLQFYTGVLKLEPERLADFRGGKAGFPSVRINEGTVIDLFPVVPDGPTAAAGEKTRGNLNHFCLVVAREEFAKLPGYLRQNGTEIREGPVKRWGARGQATSIYFLDPDGNEIELRCY